MSNSPLISYTSLSPNCSKPRNNKILKITPHHMAGNLSLKTFDNIVSNPARDMSSNYAIDSQGNIGLFCEEKNRSWCSSSSSNDNQAITIEVANDGGAPDWHVSDKALNALIDLCVDICQRNGIESLNFTGDSSGNLTQHNYFAATACPGPYLKSKFSYIADTVNSRLGGVEPVNFIDSIASYVREYAPKYDIAVCSPIIAQAIIESASGTSELGENACNYFGLKWRDGRCPTASGIYSKETKEWVNGEYITITSDFCKFPDMENGVIGYFDFINISNYDNLKGVTDPQTYIENIKADGYATSPTYVETLMITIEKYDLTQYDAEGEAPVPTENKILQVNLVNGKPKAQAFNSKDVNDWYTFEDGSVYLPIGEYDITYLETNLDADGFKWCKIKYNNVELWVVYNISDNRCTIADKPKSEPEPTPEPTPEPECDCNCEKLKAQLVAMGQEVSRLQSENKSLNSVINEAYKLVQEIKEILETKGM